jgi:uncharacterized protein YyaL (SSP411 family)
MRPTIPPLRLGARARFLVRALSAALCVGALVWAARQHMAPPPATAGEGNEQEERVSDGERGMRDAETEPRGPNRLVHEKSPYLLQHAHNPVDWFPWGEEAFRKSAEEQKPIFLSVGYATCHWCHVMERESFEDEAIARFLNEHFISVKVDREERPDVDKVYMEAVQAMTGQGGWPMTVFLTPDRKPFFGGTYFPPEDRFGRPGFTTVLRRIEELWRTKREELVTGAQRLTDHIAQTTTATAELGPDVLEQYYRSLLRSFDRSHGGFGGAPKFPRSHSLMLLLRVRLRLEAPDALRMVEDTLDAMAHGGIRDHLGGGFHRYSTDREWLVPHFEKMLYDQALLARTYLEAFLVTGEERHAVTARDIFRYVLRDLTSPAGAFFSAEDADSEGEEGKFYVWTLAELGAVLGEEDARLFAEVYGATKPGNYVDEATRRRTGANIPYLSRTIAAVAAGRGMDPAALEARLAPMREKLLAARSQRVRPLLDDKVLTDWNGLMIGTLAHGARALSEPRYAEAASRAAAFCLETLRDGDGALLHRYRDGEAGIPAFLTDHASLIWGLTELYQATFELRWLAAARDLADRMIRGFHDEELGGFRFSGSSGERLIAAPRDAYDGALPSGNSMAAYALAVLGRLTGEPRYTDLARETVLAFSQPAARFPTGHPFLLLAFDLLSGPGREVVLAGPAGDEELAAMRALVDGRFLPTTVVLQRPPGDAGAALAKLAPFTEGQVAVDGRATAYVCRGFTCRLPVQTRAALATSLDGD